MLRMQESASLREHVNEFNKIMTQLTSFRRHLIELDLIGRETNVATESENPFRWNWSFEHAEMVVGSWKYYIERSCSVSNGPDCPMDARKIRAQFQTLDCVSNAQPESWGHYSCNVSDAQKPLWILESGTDKINKLESSEQVTHPEISDTRM